MGTPFSCLFILNLITQIKEMSSVMVVLTSQIQASTISFNGHTWMAVTDQCDTCPQGWGTLYVAVD